MTSKGEKCHDWVVLLLHCPDEGSILLQQKDEVGNLFLPSTRISQNDSWKEACTKKLQQIFSFTSYTDSMQDDETTQCEIFRIMRLWYPRSQNENGFLQRIIFYKSFSTFERTCLEVTTGGFKWIPIDAVLKGGKLDQDLCEKIRKVHSAPKPYKPIFNFHEYCQDQFMIDLDLKDGSSKANQSQLLSHANFTNAAQRRLYKVFISSSFPQLFLTYPKFEDFMAKLGWNRMILPDLFRAFNRHKKEDGGIGFLSYSDFISGLAEVEPQTPHGDFSGEARCRLIFRFYDRDSDGKMKFSEFAKMVKDVRSLRGDPMEEDQVAREAITSARVFGCEEKDYLTLTSFLVGVGQLKFRGTSLLLRSPKSVLEYIKELDDKSDNDSFTAPPDRKRPKSESESVPKIPSFESVDDWDCSMNSVADFQSPLFPEHQDDYEFATHVVRVKRSGVVTDIKSLWEIEGGSSSSQAPPTRLAGDAKVKFERLQSIKAFNESSNAHEMIKGLKYFERPGGLKLASKLKKAFSWGDISMTTFASSLIELCHQTKALLVQEPRLVKLKSPTYILGDLHGNFADLVCFEKVLWRMGPNLTPANFLFLGDYVDRGQHGVETVGYLFAQKVIAPTKFHLLRGNHEVRAIQKSFSFHKECLQKFGSQLGARVWDEINRVFDVMPIAALIDGKIFCVHGGITPPWLGNGLISSIDKVQVNLPDPENDDSLGLVWEYLWNDPLPQNEKSIPKESLTQLKMPELNGFISNYVRGTGHMFSSTALEDFLRRNRLSHVIRAHEVKQAGFHVQHNEKLLTVFSSSQYCNGSNEAACVLADNMKIRLIRLDTTK